MYLLKTYESFLMTLKYEDMLHFLINEMTRTGFFQNNNLALYNEMFRATKIKNELISNLENEYIQGLKIKELEEKNKQANITLTNANMSK